MLAYHFYDLVLRAEKMAIAIILILIGSFSFALAFLTQIIDQLELRCQKCREPMNPSIIEAETRKARVKSYPGISGCFFELVVASLLELKSSLPSSQPHRTKVL